LPPTGSTTVMSPTIRSAWGLPGSLDARHGRYAGAGSGSRVLTRSAPRVPAPLFPEAYGRRRMESVIPPLLRRRSSDEYAPLPAGPADEWAASRVDEIIGAAAGSLGLSVPAYAADR